MITLSVADASQQLCRLREQLAGDTSETATLTEDGKPVLALLPWELYESLVELARLANDPRLLMLAPIEVRRRALAISAARAEQDYRSDPDLTAFEAFGEEDLFDVTE